MVDPLGHAGFAGKIRPERPDETGHMLHFGAQIPAHPFPYYADCIMEMAFIQPVLRPSPSHSSASLRSVESSDSGQDAVSMASKSSLPPVAEREPLCPQASLPLHHVPPQSASTSEGERFYTLPTRGKQTLTSRTDVPSSDPPRKKSATPQDCAVMVVWLEKYEDHTSFPLQALSGLLHGSCGRLTQRRALPCIFIHMLPSGLYQVTTTAQRWVMASGWSTTAQRWVMASGWSTTAQRWVMASGWSTTAQRWVMASGRSTTAQRLVGGAGDGSAPFPHESVKSMIQSECSVCVKEADLCS